MTDGQYCGDQVPPIAVAGSRISTDSVVLPFLPEFHVRPSFYSSRDVVMRVLPHGEYEQCTHSAK